MAFREDRDAQSERIATLERELETAKAATKDGERALTEVGALKNQIASLAAERDQLQLGVAPLAQRMQRNFIVFALVTTAGAVGFVVYETQTMGEAAAHLRERAQEAEVRASTCEDESARRADEAASAPIEVPVPAAVPVAPLPAPVDGISASGRVSRMHGPAGVRIGQACEIDIAFQSATGDCHASIVCGGHDLYPQGGGGFFACDVEDGRVVGGRDRNPTAVSRDPALTLDRARHTVEISDDDPAWAVMVTFADSDNPF